MDKPYDVVVVGLGGHGSATVYTLAKQGCNVLGIERFQSGSHANGSSHGRSRIIRQAYFEDPRYVPLLSRSFELWNSLQSEIDEINGVDSNSDREALLTMTGGLMIGLPAADVVKGTLASVKQHSLPYELLSAKEIRDRFNGVFTLTDDEVGVYEIKAGYLVPELCVEAYQKIAMKHGATLQFEEIVSKYATIIGGVGDELIRVESDKGTYYAKKLVLCAGPWAPELYGDSISKDMKLHVERRVLYWFKPTNNEESFKNIPIYIWDLLQSNNFYGFPLQGGSPDGVKVAMHLIDTSNSNDSKHVCTPQSIDRSVHENEINGIRNVIKDRIPSLNGELVTTATCMYTTTPDEHFLLDFLPYSNGNIILASPCSGHGFKFASVVGEILADLAMNKYTSHDITLFRLQKQKPRRVIIEGGGDMPQQAGQLFYDWGTDENRVTANASNKARRILVIPWASEMTAEECMDTFRMWGSNLFNDATSELVLAPLQEEMLAKQDAVKVFMHELLNATAVFFTGGDQVRIVNVFSRWPGVKAAIHMRYESGVPFAGTSAGAAIMSVTMITGNGNFEVIQPDSVEVLEGMGFVTNAIIDQHHVMRKRENRLISILMYGDRKEPYGIGIDEDMAISLVDGIHGQVLGHQHGKVLLFERLASNSEYNLKVLSTGDTFTISRIS